MKIFNSLGALLITCLCLVPCAIPQTPKALLLFGGKDHKDFLGMFELCEYQCGLGL